MPEMFEKSVCFINTLPKTEVISVEDKLNLYKYFKQSTVGACNIGAPSFFKFEERKKYEAWKSIEKLSKEEAQKKYVQLVDALYPGWQKD